MLLATSRTIAADAEVKVSNFTFDPPVLTGNWRTDLVPGVAAM
jgi:hypothetical protein